MQSTRLKTVLNYLVPTVLSQCAFFLFTIIDGIFVGNGVGTDALGAVNMALPYILILGAVFMLTTIGGVTITAIRIGRKDIDGANQAFMHAISCTFLFAAIFTIIGVVFTEPLVTALGASGLYHDMVSEYILWYSVFTIPSAISIALQGFGRNDNAPVLVMAATIISTLCNIFLDWLFIFPLQQGIAGAAIATGISQIVSLVIISMHFIRKRGLLKISRFTLNSALLKKVLKRGLPEMLSQLTTPIMIVCMNYVILKYIGSDGINAYSVMSYITSFAFAVFLGVAEGMQPLFGQSYGEKKEKDLKYYLRTGATIILIGSALVYMFTLFFGTAICNLFGAEQAAMETAVSAMPKYGWAFIFASLNTIISAYLYSTKRTKESVAVNVLRGFIFIPLCVWLLSLAFGGSFIWFTIGIAEALVFVIAIIILKRSEKDGVTFV